jgi:hypothetical protein
MAVWISNSLPPAQPEVISWVLSFGTEAELLEPANLRQQMAVICKEITGVYLT